MKRYVHLVATPLILVVLVLVWGFYVRAFEVSPLILPSPASVGASIVDLLQSPRTWNHIWYTLYETIAGFLIAVIVGIGLGALLGNTPWLERTLNPLIVGLQVMPKIALVPLFVVWFGFGLGSKIAVAAVISLFPVLVNTIAGLKGCDQGRLDVLRALGASRWDCFRLVKMPNALPFVFAGLSTAVMFALTGALVGEFVGANQGLGYLIVQANNFMDIPRVFAVLAVLCAVGTAAFGILQFARRKFLYWDPNKE